MKNNLDLLIKFLLKINFGHKLKFIFIKIIRMIYLIHIIKNNKSTIKIDYLQKNDVVPLHLRPFGPILLISTENSQSMLSMRQLNVCESMSWNHQLRKQTDYDNQWRIPCEQLYSVYSFVQSRHSWRRGYCEETVKTQRIPFKTLSYFRYSCRENITHQLR